MYVLLKPQRESNYWSADKVIPCQRQFWSCQLNIQSVCTWLICADWYLCQCCFYRSVFKFCKLMCRHHGVSSSLQVRRQIWYVRSTNDGWFSQISRCEKENWVISKRLDISYVARKSCAATGKRILNRNVQKQPNTATTTSKTLCNYSIFGRQIASCLFSFSAVLCRFILSHPRSYLQALHCTCQ